MKKLLLVLLVLLGLQTQAQWNYCDSVGYTIVPGTQVLTTVSDWSYSLLVTPSNLDSITWSWSVYTSTTYYSGYDNTGYDTTSFPLIQPTDTVTVCYDIYIYFMGATYLCTDCDTLVYDGWSNSWMRMMMSNPTGIEELTTERVNDGKMYDLLGREITEAKIGTMYIMNNKKYIRVE
jgi:hypothetical protein